MAETFALRHIAVACVLITDDRVFPCDLLANISCAHLAAEKLFQPHASVGLSRLAAIRRAHAQMLARDLLLFSARR